MFSNFSMANEVSKKKMERWKTRKNNTKHKIRWQLGTERLGTQSKVSEGSLSPRLLNHEEWEILHFGSVNPVRDSHLYLVNMQRHAQTHLKCTCSATKQDILFFAEDNLCVDQFLWKYKDTINNKWFPKLYECINIYTNRREIFVTLLKYSCWIIPPSIFHLWPH